MPPAEIVFEKPPAGGATILDYASKWDEGSPEFARSVRRFLDARAEPALHARIASSSRALWEGLGLRGYARFDFRYSKTGKLFLIDVNANPCLAAEAGFMAAASLAGRTYDETLAAILAAALPPLRAYPPFHMPDAGRKIAAGD